MKKTKIIIKLLLALVIFTQTTQAQQNAKGIKDAAIKSCGSCGVTGILSVSGGLNSSKNNDDTRLNTIGFGLDFFYPFKITNNFSWGLNGGGNYFTGNSTPSASTLPQPYLIANQISSAVTSSGDSKNSSYFVGVGPQLNFAFANRFVFSPIFQVGYLGVTQSEFKSTQTTLISGGAVPNYTKTYDLMTQTETKTSGLGFIPKARLTYMISNTFGIWAEANYSMGTTIKNSTRTFAPQGESSTQTVYSVAQMDAGTYKTVEGNTKYKAVGFNFGIVYSFRKF